MTRHRTTAIFDQLALASGVVVDIDDEGCPNRITLMILFFAKIRLYGIEQVGLIIADVPLIVA
jgi:hypothetical protein